MENISNKRYLELEEEINSLRVWKTLFNSLDDILVVISPDLRIEDINESGEKFYGRSKKQIVGNSCYQLLFNRKSPCAYCPHQMGRMNIDDVKYIEKYNEKLDKHLSIKSSPITNEYGEVTRTVDLIRDITSRKETEFRLIESERKFKSFILNSADGIVLTDERGVIIEWNNAQEDLTALFAIDVIGKYIWDVQHALIPNEMRSKLFSSTLRERARPLFEYGDADYVGIPQEVTIKKQNGNISYLETITFPIKTDKGFMSGSISRDVTHSKRDAETILAQQKNLKLLAQTALSFVDEVLDERIFEYIADILFEVVPKSYVLVNSYNQENNTITVRAGRFYKTIAEKILNLLGQGPIGMEVKLENKEAHEKLLSGKMTRIEGGINELVLGQIPTAVSAIVEKFLNSGEIYVVGIQSRGVLLGTVSIILQKHQKLEQYDLVEAFVKQASIALQRKQAQDALFANELRFRTLYQNAPVGIYRTNSLGKIQIANPALAQMLGFNLEQEMLGRNLSELGVENGKRWKGFIKLLEKTDDVKGFESDWKTKNGEMIYVLQNGRTIRNEFNEIESFECTVEDITTRKKYESGIVESEHKYRELAELLPEVVFEVALNGQVVFVNKKGLQLFNISEEVLKSGFQYDSLVADDDKSRLQRRFGEIIATKKAIASEYTFNGPNGKVPVLIHSNAIEKDGEVTGLRGVVVDLTARKKAEEALLKSEEMLNAIIKNSSDIVVILDKNFNISFISSTGILHFIKEEESYKFAESIHPDDQDEVIKGLAKLTKVENKRETFGFRIRNADNNWDFIEATAANQINNPYINGIILNLRVVTERKKAEQKIIESEQRFKDLAELLPQAVYEIDVYGKISFMNKQGLEIFEFNQDDIEKGISFNSVLPEKEFQKFKTNFSKLLSGEPVSSKEYEFHTKSKKSFPGIVYSNVVFKNENAIGVKGIIINIEEQKQLELQKKIYQNNQQFLSATALNYLRIGPNDNLYEFIIQSLYSVFDNSIVAFNKYIPEKKAFVLRSIAGAGNLIKKAKNIVGKDIFEAEFPLSEKINDALKTGKLIEFKSLSKNNAKIKLFSKTFEVLAKIIPVENIYIIGLFRENELFGNISLVSKHNYNIEDLKLIETFASQASIALNKRRLEKELMAAKEKAEESDNLKTAFLANMSHEIRTPMNGIVGFGELLRKKQQDREKRERYIEIINENSRYLLSLINDIIDISKLQAGQMRIVNLDFSINDLIDELFRFFKLDMDAKCKSDIKLKKTIAFNDGEDFIHADKLRIKQIINNLLGNAVKFTHEGSIEFGYLLINEGNKLRFFVKDTGIGLKPEKLELIFERFMQADLTTTRKYGGTGLGLSISKGIMKLLGGDLCVESTEGKGSHFYFDIDYIKASKKRKVEKKPVPKKYNFKNKKVLIVEDDEKSGIFFKDFLADLNLKYKLLRNGKNVMLLMDKENFDLVLLDAQLPDSTGDKITKEIRKKFPDIPIVIQSANIMSENRKKVFAAGCNDFLSKPIVMEEFIDVLSKYLS